jgi:CBS domain-containing protein
VSTLLDDGDHGDEGTPPHVHGDQPLAQVLARMGETRRSVLPVVSRANVGLLLGLVTLPDVLRAFGVAEGDAPPRGVSSGEATHG